MKRNGLRLLGIFLGLFLGTLGALITHNIRKSLGSKDSNAVTLPLGGLNGNGMSESGSDEESRAIVQPEDPADMDPGRRKQLRELREISKSEPNWTRSFELIERSGEVIRSEDLKGQPYVVCFFFSTCPGTCKRQSGEMRLLQSKFQGKPIRLVSISVDPDIDTPEVLKAYAEGFNADPKQWLFLTGKLDDIIKVGAEMFFLPGVERRGHPDRFCLVNAEGELVGSYIWLDRDEREQLIKHIEELLGQ